MFSWSRRKACVINGVLLLVLSLPCALGFNLLDFIKPFGEGTNIMDLEDFIVSNIFLPVGSICFVLFCTSKKGWGWKNFTKEANEGKGLKFPNFLRVYCSYVLPVIILGILIIGIYNYFA